MRVTVRLITILTFIVGVGLLSYSLTLPYYKNQEAADNLLNNAYEIDKQEYYKKEAEIRTRKTTFMDLGAGIGIASLTILIFLILTKSNNFSDLKNIMTLNKLAIFISANLVWLLLLPGTFWYYMFRGGRGDYPPFADSIGIPLMAQIPFLLFMLIPLNLFLFLTSIKTNLPTRLFARVEKYSRPTILWEIFFGFWLLLNLLCFVLFVADGDHFSIPVNLFFTYLLLNLRAGQISKYTQIKENACL
jgi:hypothetical protein